MRQRACNIECPAGSIRRSFRYEAISFVTVSSCAQTGFDWYFGFRRPGGSPDEMTFARGKIPGVGIGSAPVASVSTARGFKCPVDFEYQLNYNIPYASSRPDR